MCVKAKGECISQLKCPGSQLLACWTLVSYLPLASPFLPVGFLLMSRSHIDGKMPIGDLKLASV